MIETTTEGLADILVGSDPERRMICAIAGAPGSGKSTLAGIVTERLNAREPGCAALLQMDGYHYDDLYLVPAGLRARKGAPETFDVGGLRHILARLRARDEVSVAVPVFDRTIEISRAGAQLIPASVRIIVVEGNYLLLARQPWDSLRPCLDVTVMIDVPEPILRDRLIARWKGYGLSPAEITAKVEGNDIPNGRMVRDGSAAADFVVRQSA